MLRIDPLHPSGGAPYSVPPDNPFVGRAGADEIWSSGLRNPYRFSFDRQTGALLIGDVGQSTREEVDYEPQPNAGRGDNFGWSCREGLVAFATDRPALLRRLRVHRPDPRLPAVIGLRGDRRLRRPRPDPRRPRRALRLRRLLPGPDPLARPGPAGGERRPLRGVERPEPELVRRGRLRPPLRRLPERRRLALRRRHALALHDRGRHDPARAGCRGAEAPGRRRPDQARGLRRRGGDGHGAPQDRRSGRRAAGDDREGRRRRQPTSPRRRRPGSPGSSTVPSGAPPAGPAASSPPASPHARPTPRATAAGRSRRARSSRAS